MTSLMTQKANQADLQRINAIVVAAIDTWQLAPRLARLVSITHQYEEADFLTMDFYFLCKPDHSVVGILALEPQQTDAIVLLHGLYVMPEHQNQGFGRQAIEIAKQWVQQANYSGLLVKAHASAKNFFAQQALQQLPIKDPERDYPHRYYWSVSGFVSLAQRNDNGEPQ